MKVEYAIKGGRTREVGNQRRTNKWLHVGDSAVLVVFEPQYVEEFKLALEVGKFCSSSRPHRRVMEMHNDTINPQAYHFNVPV